MLASQRIVQVCLVLFAAIGVCGGILQMLRGQPETSPRLDNVHRFMAGVYLGTGVICGWAAWTVTEQRTLVYLIALGIFLAGVGRLISIRKVGLPKPSGVWIAYMIPELGLPPVMVAAQLLSRVV